MNTELHLKTLHDDAFQDGVEQGIEQGIEQGKLQVLYQLVQEGVLTEQDAAERAGLSLEDFLKQTRS